jgi:hypothetical protein
VNINLTTPCSFHYRHVTYFTYLRINRFEFGGEIDRNVEVRRGTRFLKVAFVLLGAVLVVLSLFLPILMRTAAERQSNAATFGAGYLRSLTPFITTASMASTFVAAAAILSFEKSRITRMSVLFASLTFSVFASEIALSVYLLIVRSQSSAVLAPLPIYALIGLVPFGLACTMFTFASIMSRAL